VLVGRDIPTRPAVSSRVELRLAGTFGVIRDGTELSESELGSRKSRTLLKLLTVERPGLVPVDRIVEVLWVDDPPAAAEQNVATLAAARHVRQALKPNGTWLVVEPFAADDTAGNLNPVGRVYYGASTLLCVPNAMSQPGGYSLGAQAGEAAIRQVVTEAGFTRFRRASETPFNLVYEARP
jgi:hypothetical protein